jgi:hypothetical protein
MSSQIPEPVARLLDAANKHDTNAFLECFGDDGVVDDWGREFAGVPAIREWSDREFIGAAVTLKIVGSSVRRNGTIDISADVGGNGYNGPSHFIFTLQNGQVARMAIRE